MLHEFKLFAMKGNVVDLAVGVVIGTAFGAIVNSMVGDVIMPIIGALTGNIDFTGLHFSIGDVTVAYGKFLQTIFSFLVIAWALFFVVKAIIVLRKKEEIVQPIITPEPSPEAKLLTEIRDLLKK
jgi:large conductance mechanosensitive channel